MIIEKNVLSELVEKYIETDCAKNSKVNEKLKFKTYLKKDDNNCFVIVDKENCIKCLFYMQFIEQYFSTYPCSTNLDQYDGMLIMVKKAEFDVLFYKNINKTVSYRVVLCVLEFELDNAQKMSIENYNASYSNVNFASRIEEKMNEFYYNYISNICRTNYQDDVIKNHLAVNARTFIKKPFNDFNSNKAYCSIRKVFPKGCSLTFLHNRKDSFAFLNDENALMIKEIEVQDNHILQDNNSIEDDNINVETLKKLDFNSLFYKKQQNSKVTLPLSMPLSMPLVIPSTQIEKCLGNKRKRDEENDIPINIRNLINKMENKSQITIGIFEKYKNYKKYNIGEFTKDKI